MNSRVFAVVAMDCARRSSRDQAARSGRAGRAHQRPGRPTHAAGLGGRPRLPPPPSACVLLHLAGGGLARQHGVGQQLHDQLDRADAVVVAGDRQIHLVRIAVGVDQGDGGDAQLPGLADGVLLLAGIDDHQALGQPVHGPHAVEVAVHLAVLAVQGRLHLLRVGGQLLAGPHGLELFQAAEPAADGAEVGQRAAQPAVADEGHAAAQRLLLDGFGRLPLGADEQDQAALGGDPLQVLSGPQQAADRLADVDDVDQVAAAVDVRPHLGVPAAGPMAEMDPCFDQVFYQDGSQEQISQRHTGEVLARGGGVRRWCRTSVS